MAITGFPNSTSSSADALQQADLCPLESTNHLITIHAPKFLPNLLSRNLRTADEHLNRKFAFSLHLIWVKKSTACWSPGAIMLLWRNNSNLLETSLFVENQLWRAIRPRNPEIVRRLRNFEGLAEIDKRWSFAYKPSIHIAPIHWINEVVRGCGSIMTLLRCI
jgi:hypothetical protein